MKLIKYFIEFFFILFLFFIFKIIGVKNSSNFGCFLFQKIGPLFRKKNKIEQNIKIVFPDITNDKLNKIIKNMWCNFGRVFAEYMHLDFFRKNQYDNIKIVNIEKLIEIKNNKKPTLFYSGHFANFELLAMIIEKNDIDIHALYRPLNNIFLNPIMEKLRINHICKSQIPKTIPGKNRDGTRKLVNLIKEKKNIALMVDQKVNEGIKVNFFGKEAYTINIPAQLAMKHNYNLIPLEIKRINSINFIIKINDPIEININDDQFTITKKINSSVEQMILNNPEQWIWTHDRWRV